MKHKQSNFTFKEKIMHKLKNIRLLSLLGILGSMSSCSSQSDGKFPFKSYERKSKDGGGADIVGATRDFLIRAPIGSNIAEYEKIFSDLGGQCEILNTKEYKNVIRCTYKHSRIFVCEWIVVITFDPLSKKSESIKLNFGINGL